MKVLTFFNHAGGVAKTSTVRDVGYVLGEMGKRVLLIDLDPQANLTKWLGVDEDITLSQTVYPAVLGDTGAAADEDAGHGTALALPEPLHVHGMDLIPGALSIAIIEREILSVFMGVVRLREALRRLEGYDYVLIDPPPSLGQLSARRRGGRPGRGTATHQPPGPRHPRHQDGARVRRRPKLDIALFVLTQHDRRTRHDRESLG